MALSKKNKITLRNKSIDNELHESQMIKLLPVAVYTCNAEGYIQTYNNASVELWGRAPEVGKDLWCGSWKSFTPKGDAMSSSESSVAIALKEGRIVSSEVVIEKPNGERRNVISHPQLIYDEKGEITGAINTLIDITEQNQLRKTTDRFQLLADSMSQLVWTADESGNYNYFNKAVYDYSGLKYEAMQRQGWFAIVHPDDRGESEKKWKHSIATGHDFHSEHRLCRFDGTYRWYLSQAAAEKDAEGKVQAWIGTTTDISESKSFAFELDKSVAERTADLIKQNQFTQTLIDSSVDSIMVIDLNEVVISLNKAANDLFSPYLTESIVGKTLEEIDPTTKSKPDWKYTDAALKGEYIYRKHVKAENEERYFDIYYIPLKKDNETYAIMLIIREVTEVVLAKLEIEKVNKDLKERNEFIETIIDNSHEWIAVYDKDLTLITLNRTCEKMLGVNREDLIGRELADVFPSVIGTKFESDLLQALNGEHIQNDIYYSNVSNNFFKNYISPLKDTNGNVYAALVIAHNMTEFKLAEDKIKKANLLLSGAQRLANIGSWEWDVLSNEINWTDELYRIFGVSRDTFENTFENYLNRVHPLDRELVSESIREAMRTHKPYDFYHRIVIPDDGTIKILHGKGEVFLNENEEVIRLSGTAQCVTQSIEMENKLKQSQLRYRLMTEQIEDYAIIFLSPKGKIEAWNKGAQKIKGYTEAEIIGLNFTVFFTEEERAKKTPAKLLKEAKENKKSINEGWRVRKDGTKFWASIVLTALIDEKKNLIGFSKLTRDLTEQKKAEEKINKHSEKITQQNLLLEVINKDLANQKAFAELLVESSPLMIFSYDENMLITTWNKKSEEYNNIKKEDVLGRPIFEVFNELDNKSWINNMNEVLKSGKTLHFPKVQLKQASIWGEIFLVPLRDIQNKIIGGLSITKEITELVKITSDLEMKNEELEKSNKELASFSYIASHDLQEPLRKISTFTSRLKEKHEDQLSEDVQQYIEKIESSSKRMTTLIKDLLDYSRLNDPQKVFERTDLNLILKNVLNDFELLIEQKNAQIKIGKLPIIEAMPLQMNQLFYNLMSNALKFSKTDESLIISVSARKIPAKEIKAYPQLINSKNTRGYYELIFKDNGIGFEQKYAEQIFSIFKRLHSKTEYIGTGIGLGLSKKIVENHNGEIFCKSIKNEGSTFYVILPIEHQKLYV